MQSHGRHLRDLLSNAAHITSSQSRSAAFKETAKLFYTNAAKSEEKLLAAVHEYDLLTLYGQIQANALTIQSSAMKAIGIGSIVCESVLKKQTCRSLYLSLAL